MLFCFLLSSSAYIYISSYLLLARNIYIFLLFWFSFFSFLLLLVCFKKYIYKHCQAEPQGLSPAPMHARMQFPCMHSLPT